MSRIDVMSDQSVTWSDAYVRAALFDSQAPSLALAAQAAAVGLCLAGFIDRALQALRQAGLQVCRWARSRAQVLPIGELSRQVAEDGLRPSRRLLASERARGQLRPGSRDLGGDLRDQSRTVAPARANLRRSGEPRPRAAHRFLRSVRRCHAARQHAHHLDRGSVHAHVHRGGPR
jgi:hypothetical protein